MGNLQSDILLVNSALQSAGIDQKYMYQRYDGGTALDRCKSSDHSQMTNMFNGDPRDCIEVMYADAFLTCVRELQKARDSESDGGR